jgi:hypothetical protein
LAESESASFGALTIARSASREEVHLKCKVLTGVSARCHRKARMQPAIHRHVSEAKRRQNAHSRNACNRAGLILNRSSRIRVSRDSTIGIGAALAKCCPYACAKALQEIILGGSRLAAVPCKPNCRPSAGAKHWHIADRGFKSCGHTTAIALNLASRRCGEILFDEGVGGNTRNTLTGNCLDVFVKLVGFAHFSSRCFENYRRVRTAAKGARRRSIGR